MNHVATTYIENESLVEEEDSPRLRLPSRDMVTYENSDLEFLSQIRNEDDFVSLVQEYIFGTVSEAIRLVEGFPLDHFLTDELKFVPSSHLCSAHHARWDILALVSLVKLPPLLRQTHIQHTHSQKAINILSHLLLYLCLRGSLEHRILLTSPQDSAYVVIYVQNLLSNFV